MNDREVLNQIAWHLDGAARDEMRPCLLATANLLVEHGVGRWADIDTDHGPKVIFLPTEGYEGDEPEPVTGDAAANDDAEDDDEDDDFFCDGAIPPYRCPSCGEVDPDHLVWLTDETVQCDRCDTVYRLKMGRTAE